MEFFKSDFYKKIYSLISVLLLEGIVFYNFTSPEFNVNVCQLPFWAATVFYAYKSINHEKTFRFNIVRYFYVFRFFNKIPFYLFNCSN